MRIILIAILVYLAYQFIFNFLIPVFITAQKIKKGFRKIQAEMNHSGSDARTNTSYSSPKQGPVQKPSHQSAGKDDYLDFEEIK